MASSTIAKDLTSFFKSSLSPEDQDNLGKLIEDYFCDEEDITDMNDMDDYDDDDDDDDSIDLDDVDEGMEVVITDAAVTDCGNNTEREEMTTAEEREVEMEKEGIVDIEMREIDMKEEDSIRCFVAEECGCTLFNGTSCSTNFSLDYYRIKRNECAELDHDSLDLVIMAQIMANSSDGSVRHRGRETHDRKRMATQFFHNGKKVCRRTFLFLHGVGACRFKALRSYYMKQCLSPRTHGNTTHRPHNALTMEDIQHLVQFLHNYAKVNAILLPGRLPGYKKLDVQLLPSHTTKQSVWEKYSIATGTSSVRIVGFSAFCKLWKQYVPQILITKPRSDLCWVCQKNSTALIRSANTPEEEKTEVYKMAEKHIKRATTERCYYRDICKQSSVNIKTFFNVGDVFSPPPPNSNLLPCSLDSTVHYSFDFAQQVHYPSNPFQPGPVYFLAPRKCGLFGVCCEGIPRQVNFLIDEAVDVGKGANGICSMLHYFFSHHSLGETNVHLHADNCVGQNKNNIVLQYLIWRVMTGLHHSITYSFLPVGHTKFSPDWCFGLMKQRYRRTKVDSLQDLVDVVNGSAHVNFAQLVGTQEGDVLVPTYNWGSYLSPYFKRVDHIKKFHSFQISSPSSGDVEVVVREYSDTPQQHVNLVRDTTWIPSSTVLPPVCKPVGLSSDRQWYLFDKIREYCADNAKDLSCPLPSVPRSSTTPCQSELTTLASDEPLSKKRKCGKCGHVGHNSRTCSN